jgi:DNA gyrase subunit B/topoisomerase-4 subunit B
MATTYTARDITVLEGLEPVRKRPGMYIGGVDARGLHHLVNEIVDNAIDEVINGYATRLEVTLFEGGREIEVADNGRGIPVDVHPKYRKSALELILTTLHSGGKFDQGNYVHSGGLHGVGSSVVCALSSEMTVTVKRDGHEWRQTYARGKATSKVQKISGGEKVRGSGTTVRFRPDAEIFGKLSFEAREIRERLEAKTYLHRGLRVVFLDETEKPPRRDELTHEGGLSDWLMHVVEERGKATTGGTFNLAREGEPRLELALVWTEATDEHVRSYVNGISTPSGGTHENGLRSGIARASSSSCPRTFSSRSSRARRKTASTTPRSRHRWTEPSVRRSKSGSTRTPRSPNRSSGASSSLRARAKRAARRHGRSRARRRCRTV